MAKKPNTRQDLPPAPVAEGGLIKGAVKPLMDYYTQGNPVANTMGIVSATAYWPALSGGVYSMDSRFYAVCEEMLHKDAKISALLGSRIAAVTALPRLLEPASSDPADQDIHAAVADALEDIGINSLLEHILTALIYGLSVIEVDWQACEGMVEPAGFTHHHPSLFVFDAEGNLFLSNQRNTEPLPRERFLVATHGAQFGNPYGDGLCSKVMFLYWFKKQAVAFWMQAAERVAAPAVLGKYPAANANDLAAMNDLLSTMAQNGFASIPDSWDIAPLHQSTEGGTFGMGLAALCDWIDGQIAMAISGGTLTSSEGQHGTQALGSVHQGLANDRLAADIRFVQEAVNKQLIEPFVRWNFGPEAECPKWTIDVKEVEDFKSKAETYAILNGLGLPLGVAHMYETFQIPIPEEGEEVLKKAPPPPNPFGPPPAPGADPEETPEAEPAEEEEPAADDNPAAGDDVESAQADMADSPGWKRVILGLVPEFLRGR